MIKRRGAKLSVTVDADLLGAVERWLSQHPGLDRSAVIDEALRLWLARQQERAMEAQFSEDPDVDPEEWAAWRSIRRAAAERLIGRRGDP